MKRKLLISALALPWWIAGQGWIAGQATAQPPSQPPSQPMPAMPPVPPGSSRMITMTPPGSYLGIGIQEITAERAKALKLREEAGVEITRVAPDSPADKAGLKEGDVVLQFNSMRVEGLEQLSRLVRETPTGREVKLEIFRNGASQTVTAKIAGHASPLEGLRTMPDVPRIIQGLRNPMLGVEAESIDGQLAQYFGVSDGVLVRSVMRGSAAERAGIKAGDVILRVDETKVLTPAEISTRLRAARGKPVPVAVMREHKEVNITVEAADSRAGRRGEPVRFVDFDNQ